MAGYDAYRATNEIRPPDDGSRKVFDLEVGRVDSN